MLAYLLIFAISTISFIIWNARRKKFPPGPIPVPFFGNIFQLTPGEMYRDFLRWKKVYGPVFTVWIPTPHVIVNDYELVKEYFVKQGEIFAGRPSMNYFVHHNDGDYGLVMNDNAFYKSQRRFALHSLRDFGLGRPILQETIIDQANKVVQRLKETNGQPVDLTLHFVAAVGNIIFQLVFGHTFEFGDKKLHMFQHNIEVVFESFNSMISILVEIHPKLRLLDPLFGNKYENGLRKRRELQEYVKKEIEEHKRTILYENEPRDYIDAFLQEMHKREKENNLEEFTDHQLVISVIDLFAAGFDTTSITLRNFVLYMMHYPKIQQKIHEELDRGFEKDHQITLNDQNKLPYLNAVIHELQRIAVLGQLTPQHIVLEDAKMGDYTIPKGTIVIPQIATIHLDETEFSDPEKFLPERHLDKNGLFVKDDRIIPFGIGKRACLGESLARMELFLLISILIHKFEFLPEVDGKLPPFKYKSGLVLSPLPFKCRVVLRK